MTMRESSDLREPTPTGVHLQWGVKIPLRDGTLLSASLYSPKGKTGAAPCVFALTPYTVHRNHPGASYFAARGYFFLVVDVRGRGNSGGTFRPFIQEARDGYDIVEWIAKQSFCNGRVSMFGGSYGGYVQWATAKEFPPHLSAISPAVAAAPGVDMTMRSNISYPYLMQWLTLVSGHTSQQTIFEDLDFWRGQFSDWYKSGRPFRELDSMVGNPSATFQEWQSHPVQDAYWDAFTPTADDFARLNLPILTITGCYDSDQPGALHYYREHLRNASPDAIAKHYLVIGPWDHFVLAPKQEFGGIKFGPAAMLDVQNLHFEWYRWTLQDGPKPAFLQKNAAYYVMGAEKWRYADTLDAITAHSKPFYLDSSGTASHILASGSLGERAGKGPEDSYIYDPRDISIADAESKPECSPQVAAPPPVFLRPFYPVNSLVDQAHIRANEGKVLIYHSAPFLQETELSGYFKLTAWISIDQPDTDFMVTIYEITRDDLSILLTSDLMRARYRESLREEKLIRTTEPLRYEFDRFTFVSREFQKGSRLRLVIGPINSIFNQKNYNSGKAVADESMSDARPVTVKLFHDASHPSALYVPFGQPGT